MREAIRQRLLTAVPALNGRAYQLHEDVSSASLPYAIVVQGPETVDRSWMGWQRTFEIWPHADKSEGFEAVDALAEAAIQALDGQMLTTGDAGRSFVCRYAGSIDGDALNDAQTALTRGLRFAACGLPIGGHPGAAQDDGWLAALQAWSVDVLGSGWTVYADVWPANFQKPALLWRVAQMSLHDGSYGSYEVRKRLAGHVVGLDRKQELAAVADLFGQMRTGMKLPIDDEETSWVRVMDVEADLQADALTAGQIAITLSRRENRASLEAPLMQQISIYSK
jgi:hypothetical protein